MNSKPETYPIILKKAARYNFRDVIITRGQIIHVSAQDRNWLVKSKHFIDYVKEEPLVMVDEPDMEEGDSAFNPPPKIVGREPTPEDVAGSVPVMSPADARTTKRPSGPRKGSQTVNEAAAQG